MQLLLIHSDYIEFEAKRPTKMAEEIEDSAKKGRPEEAVRQGAKMVEVDVVF